LADYPLHHPFSLVICHGSLYLFPSGHPLDDTPHLLLTAHLGIEEGLVPRILRDEHLDPSGLVPARPAPPLDGPDGTRNGLVEDHEVHGGDIKAFLGDLARDKDTELPPAEPVYRVGLLILAQIRISRPIRLADEPLCDVTGGWKGLNGSSEAIWQSYRHEGAQHHRPESAPTRMKKNGLPEREGKRCLYKVRVHEYSSI